MAEKPQRNLVIDALRGLCLVLMTVDHLPDNVFYRLSNTILGPLVLFTDATGFMLLSGFRRLKNSALHAVSPPERGRARSINT
jgi:hypothetical protein